MEKLDPITFQDKDICKGCGLPKERDCQYWLYRFCSQCMNESYDEMEESGYLEDCGGWDDGDKP